MPPAIGGLVRVAIGMHRDQTALGMRRQHHHRLRPRHSLDRADRTDEPLERRSVLGFDFHHERVLTGDVMAFEDVVEQCDGFLEQRNCLRMRDRDADECSDVLGAH